MTLKTKLLTIVGVSILIGALLFATQKDKVTGFRPAFDAEFLARPDGYRGLKKIYKLEFPVRPLQMEPGLMYRALKDKAVNVINAFATDGRIPAYNLITLEDDRGFFPPYYAAPVIRRDTLDKYPELESVLNVLAGRITQKKMQQLNYKVDEKRMRAADVAADFLVSEGLIQTGNISSQPTAGRVAVGAKHFTEQEILGEMLSLLIEQNTSLQVKRYLNLGGTLICFNALRTGGIDIYAEYTGTGLINILNEDMVSDPEQAYQKVKEEFKEQFDILWLKPFGFNNTYTLTMRKDEAEKLAIESISDLSEFLQNQ